MININLGDRIKFRAVTRSSARSATRKVTGLNPVTVTYHGWAGFIVHAHEIIEIYPDPEAKNMAYNYRFCSLPTKNDPSTLSCDSPACGKERTHAMEYEYTFRSGQRSSRRFYCTYHTKQLCKKHGVDFSGLPKAESFDYVDINDALDSPAASEGF